MSYWTAKPFAGPKNLTFGLFLALAAIACESEATEPSTPPSPDPSADVQVTSSGEDTAALGLDVTYAVTVENLGPDAATDVVVRAELSGSLDVVSASDGGAAQGTTVTWPPIASLAAGSSRDFDLVVRPNDVGDISLSATAGTATDDPDETNNDGTGAGSRLTTKVERQADLRITSDAPSAVDGGDTIVVALTVGNEGPSGASQVVVLDSLPGGVEVVDVSDGGVQDGEVVTWPPVESLPAGESISYQVTFVAPVIGPFRSIHRVEGEETDPDTSNDREAARTLVTATPVRTIQGNLAGEQFGWEVEPVGDVDGDGAADLAVAAPFGGNNGGASGSIYIHSGDDGGLIRRLDGQAGDWLGIDMDAGADFTADGRPELIVGAPGAAGGSSAGRVYVFDLVDGTAVQVLTGENAGDRFGWSAAPAGDVNGDGTPDLYVGARDSDAAGTNSGKAYVYSGDDWSLLLSIDGASSGDRFGQAGGGVGDLDGDGFDDIAVGAPDYSAGASAGPGRVRVISGATGQDLLPPLEADATGVSFGGFWVFGPGDISGDGVPDIVAADLNNSAEGANTGRLYVLSGFDGSPVHTLTGEAAGDQFGIAHPAGDLDGDGVPDLSVAAWLSSEGGTRAGKVYLYSGVDGELLRTITSTVSGENFGFDAYVIGDVTGDGIPDLAVSGGISQSTTGHVKLYRGLEP